MEVSRRTEEFCLQHGIEKKKAMQMGLFVEEMASNVIEVAEKRGTENASVDFRLNISGEKISFSLMDLSGQANPQLFYEMNLDRRSGKVHRRPHGDGEQQGDALFQHIRKQ